MRATASHSSASCTSCVVTIRVRPSSRSRRSSAQIVWRSNGSTPAVGSSRKTSWGSWTRAQASWSRRCMPPDSRDDRRFRASVRSSQRSIVRIRRRRRGQSSPNRLATKSRFSRTVRSSYRATSWGMNPIRSRVRSRNAVGSSPSTRADPLVGRRLPVSRRSAVVLPAPLGPITPTSDPGSTARLTSSRATTSPKVRPAPISAATGSTVGSSAGVLDRGPSTAGAATGTGRSVASGSAPAGGASSIATGRVSGRAPCSDMTAGQGRLAAPC